MTTAPLPIPRSPTGEVRLGTGGVLPGLIACAAVALAAALLQAGEQQMFGRAWLEALVLAILVGAAVRWVWTPGPRWRPGVTFAGRTLLEVAVVLLGASISAATLLAAGPWLLGGIALVVAAVLPASYLLGRLLGLPRRLATLVACGNSICGNSAIAAVAPVIGADGDDVASAVAFTAVLGVAVVLGLPVLGAALHMGAPGYGALSGLTVYAVPQVLAAAAPMGARAVQLGALVKLVRVLMLGPVCFALSLLTRRKPTTEDAEASMASRRLRPPTLTPAAVSRMIPWFIVGFIAMIAVRSSGVLPQGVLSTLAWTASVLTVIAMAALGLGTDLRTVARASGRVTAAAVGSLAVLAVFSLGLIRVLHLP